MMPIPSIFDYTSPVNANYSTPIQITNTNRVPYAPIENKKIYTGLSPMPNNTQGNGGVDLDYTYPNAQSYYKSPEAISTSTVQQDPSDKELDYSQYEETPEMAKFRKIAISGSRKDAKELWNKRVGKNREDLGGDSILSIAKKVGAEFGVDPALLMAKISLESHGADPIYLESPDGPAQIIPSTAREIENKYITPENLEHLGITRNKDGSIDRTKLLNGMAMQAAYMKNYIEPRVNLLPNSQNFDQDYKDKALAYGYNIGPKIMFKRLVANRNSFNHYANSANALANYYRAIINQVENKSKPINLP